MLRTGAAVFLLAVSTAALAEIKLSGYLKSFVVAQDELDNPVFQFDKVYQSQSSARIMLDGFSGRITWQLHYE
ncbi:MAG: hypothetical protein OSA83_16190, partial [Pseudomonadales bacterium]|nr:hypothetical protein [Pseudomonadales bacterium]